MMKIKRIHPVWIKYPLLYFLIFELSLCLLLYAGLKNFSEAFQDEGVRVQLLSEVQSIRPGQPFSLALRITPDDNWHTYWKNPGDSGLSTKIEWDLPHGFTAGELQWPLPQIFKTPTAVSFGYEEEILLITEIKAPETIKSGSKITLSASVDWLACKDGCVPGHADLSIILPVKNKKPKIDTQWVNHFAKARAHLPKIPLNWKIKAFVKNDNIVLQAIPPSGSKIEFKKVMFFPEQRGLIDFSEFLKSEKTDSGYMIEIRRSRSATELPARLKGVLLPSHAGENSQKTIALRIDVPLLEYQ